LPEFHDGGLTEFATQHARGFVRVDG
jgi:hypothetical protein